MAWPCFMVEYAGDAEARLRVYDQRSEERPRCEQHEDFWYCEASRPIGRVPCGWVPGGRHYESLDRLAPPDSSRRWPARCDHCGRLIPREARKRTVSSDYYYRAEDGREWLFRDLPVGAMFAMPWMGEHNTGPDGISLGVILPPQTKPGYHPHVWCIDGPSSTGGRWTRTGAPPSVSASPSILTDLYHSFLVGGVLGDSLPDRPLPPDA